MFTTLITILAIIVIGGALIWLLDRSPIDGDVKQWGKWLMLVVIVIVVITQVLPLVGLHT
jgi:hypothetical protein